MSREPTVGEVECYSGHAYAVEPRAVIWQGVRHPVASVITRWRTPAGPAFRVRTAAGTLFDLAYDEAHGVWTLAPYGEDTPS
ncbi:MAG: hypothetical protein JXA93_10225 [Anaerolineae bacterium]|nr:hypothetical protein [Anaerolineae bacterium]